MEILGDRHAYVRLIPSEPIRDTSFPANLEVGFDVEVAAWQFTGAAPDIGFHTDDVEQFVADLDQLDARVEGSAKLESMSPGEFTLQFMTVGLARHLIVLAQLKRQDWLEDRPFDQSVSIGFGIELAEVSKTANALRAYLQSGQE